MIKVDSFFELKNADKNQVRASDERISEIASTMLPSEYMDACTVAKDFLASLDPATPFIYEDLPALEL